MTSVLVSVPEERAQAFLTWLDTQGLEHHVQNADDYDVAEWQKEVVRERMAKAKPEDYLDWEEVRASFLPYALPCT